MCLLCVSNMCSWNVILNFDQPVFVNAAVVYQCCSFFENDNFLLVEIEFCAIFLLIRISLISTFGHFQPVFAFLVFCKI